MVLAATSPAITVIGVIIWIVCLVLNIYLAKKKNRSIRAVFIKQ